MCNKERASVCQMNQMVLPDAPTPTPNPGCGPVSINPTDTSNPLPSWSFIPLFLAKNLVNVTPQ